MSELELLQELLDTVNAAIEEVQGLQEQAQEARNKSRYPKD